MKYIDADLLRKEIEYLKAVYIGHAAITKETNVVDGLDAALQVIDSLQQETLEINLEKFTEKMEDWKARFSYPDSIPVKATMAFTARMFYIYPDIAREWYAGLPKVTQD